MKIVDVCAFYAPNGGGVRTYVHRKLIAGPRAGHEITIVAPGARTWTETRGPGARIRWLKSPRFPMDTRYRFFADRAALHRILDEEAPDVVEASSPWRSASMVAEWPGHARRALIAHADPLAAYAYRWFEGVANRATIDRQFDWYWRHLRRLDARFDLVVSASDSLSARLRGGGLRKVVTNPMGVDAQVFSPTLRDRALRQRLLALCGLGEDATLLLGVGRHAPEKRWPMITEAVTAAACHHPIGLVIVGDGRGRQSLANAIGINPHIRLLAPIADRTELARLMASADALVHGCEAETFCLVAAEARASGLPLIVPDAGGAADQLQGGDGWHYRAASSADAAAVIAVVARVLAGGRRVPGSASTPIRTMDDHFAALFDLYNGGGLLKVAA